jgi:acetoin utilization deacetylase AcuC-like enzyme
MYIYHRIIEPIIKEFDPEVILVSSGFDAAVGDPLGGFTVTPTGYHYITKNILELKKPTLIALEGGYNLTAIKKSAHGVIRALLK